MSKKELEDRITVLENIIKHLRSKLINMEAHQSDPLILHLLKLIDDILN